MKRWRAVSRKPMPLKATAASIIARRFATSSDQEAIISSPQVRTLNSPNSALVFSSTSNSSSSSSAILDSLCSFPSQPLSFTLLPLSNIVQIQTVFLISTFWQPPPLVLLDSVSLFFCKQKFNLLYSLRLLRCGRLSRCINSDWWKNYPSRMHFRSDCKREQHCLWFYWIRNDLLLRWYCN